MELTQEQLLELYDPYISLDDEHSACPFCPRSKARRATLDRMVYVRGDGEEKSYRENGELAKDLGGFLFGDLLFSAESKWALSERFQTDRECSFPMDTRARSEPEKTVGARPYRSSRLPQAGLSL